MEKTDKKSNNDNKNEAKNKINPIFLDTRKFPD